MMHTKLLASLLFISRHAYATELFFVENSNEVPGKVNFWKLDGQNATNIATIDTTGTRDFVSGATVCGSTYVGAWDIFPQSFGLATVSTSSGETNYLQTDYLNHAVACHPTMENTALVIGSQPGAKHAQFSIQTVNLTSGAASMVGLIPTPKDEDFEGWDTIFSFSADKSQIYAAFGKKNVVFPDISASVLFVLDSATGKVIDTYSVDGQVAGGALYTVFSGLERAITVDSAKIPYQLAWVNMKCAGKKCTLHRTADDTIEWSDGKPFAVCGDDAYVVAKTMTQGSQPLYHSSVSTGKTTQVVDLAKLLKLTKGDVGGLAAAC